MSIGGYGIELKRGPKNYAKRGPSILKIRVWVPYPKLQISLCLACCCSAGVVKSDETVKQGAVNLV